MGQVIKVSPGRDGWTGNTCVPCGGSGKVRFTDYSCRCCGGTGEEYVRALDERQRRQVQLWRA